MTNLTELTLTQARALLKKREISATELAQETLDQIAAHDGAIGAYLTVTGERALADAAAADKAIAAGDDRPMLGIPLGIKDVLSTTGIETTCGSKILEGYKPVYTATSVKKLEDAGMVMLGKLNMDEFAMGSSTENSAYKRTTNPWNTGRVPGGSSGGSAAAVAAGMALGTLGTDTGGSIRQPGAFCGVVGLKPSYGRVSRYGLVAFGSSLDVAGPLTKTVADAAAILQVIAGHDPLDATSMDVPVPDYSAALTGDIRGLRVGVPKEYFIDGMQPDVERSTREAIAQLKALGAEIVEISLPHTEYALPVYYIIAPAEASANLARYDGIRFGKRIDTGDMWGTYKATRGQGFGSEVKRRIMLGTYALSAGYYDAYYGKAQQVRTLLKRDFDEAFQQVDVIAAPTTPKTAFPFGANTSDPLQMYLEDVFTLPASMAGVPGMSVPCGFDQDGLPIGLQLIGPAFGEENVLRAGHAYEQATEWHRRVPVLG
ncbi:MAG: Asp-tRNA(Asn)/Glu-tRNA(Gln) amidotransferase subunit GatA [Pleurocapsa minor GSE-CHR-MK-17-07R]|jgi:aspartyl-tRNA(Asn)/glutamyl-tRNA(Gln) amidotransferase subunit A|nr:Asp-tRNA(Asn)/Glu-tRNA(Gln) amidotransferase subunit GatA [Pleurocapsa minor GSE-CHR-MK 17-07R]